MKGTEGKAEEETTEEETYEGKSEGYAHQATDKEEGNIWVE